MVRSGPEGPQFARSVVTLTFVVATNWNTSWCSKIGKKWSAIYLYFGYHWWYLLYSHIKLNPPDSKLVNHTSVQCHGNWDHPPMICWLSWSRHLLETWAQYLKNKYTCEVLLQIQYWSLENYKRTSCQKQVSLVFFVVGLYNSTVLTILSVRKHLT